jgi:hypothetical protein
MPLGVQTFVLALEKVGAWQRHFHSPMVALSFSELILAPADLVNERRSGQ